MPLNPINDPLAGMAQPEVYAAIAEGFPPDLAREQVPGWVRERWSTCRTCQHWQRDEQKCEYYPNKTCRWRHYIARPNAVCPDKPPRWYPVRVKE